MLLMPSLAPCRACTTPVRLWERWTGGAGEEASASYPPGSPLLLGRRTSNTSSSSSSNAGRRGAADIIMEECERLFCPTIGSTFRVTRERYGQYGLLMGSHDVGGMKINVRGRGLSFGSSSVQSYSSHRSDQGGGGGQDVVLLGLGTPSSVASSDMDARFDLPDIKEEPSLVAQYLQTWDYAGGAKFKGFTTLDKAMFIFFDQDVLGRELKQGLMALIELASTPMIDCTRLVVCLERAEDHVPDTTIMRDLRWVGFEPATLAQWAEGFDMTSERWVFLDMEL